jgi:hypothetical protein
MTVTHVTHVTGFPTCINCDRKHSLSNREEKLGFGETVRCFFSMLLHVGKPVTPVTPVTLGRSTQWGSTAISGEYSVTLPLRQTIPSHLAKCIYHMIEVRGIFSTTCARFVNIQSLQ